MKNEMKLTQSVKSTNVTLTKNLSLEIDTVGLFGAEILRLYLFLQFNSYSSLRPTFNTKMIVGMSDSSLGICMTSVAMNDF